jgi:hypothetical protein
MTSPTTAADLAAVTDPLADRGLDHCDRQLQRLDCRHEVPLRGCGPIDYPLFTRPTISRDNPARHRPEAVSVHGFRRLTRHLARRRSGNTARAQRSAGTT